MSELCGGSLTVEQPIPIGDGGSTPTPSLQISATDFVITRCEFSDIRAFVERHHYSHNVNGVTTQYCFQALHKSRLIGAIIYGWMSTTAWKKFGTTEHKIIELRRLVMLDEAGKNSESRFVGWTLRWLKKNTDIETVVSYADPAHGHTGIIYRASNFEHVGMSAKDIGYVDPEDGKLRHSRSLRTRGNNGEYKPFVKKLRAKLAAGLLTIVPLPSKHCYVYKIRKSN